MSSSSILLWYSLMYLSKLTDYIPYLRQVIFIIELVSFEKFRETWDMWLGTEGEGTRSFKEQKDFHLFSSTQIYLCQGLRRKRLTLQLPEKKWAQDSSKKVDIHWLWSDTRRLLISSAILKALRSAKWNLFFSWWRICDGKGTHLSPIFSLGR